MNEVAVVYDGEIDVNTIPEFDGWYETISESTENGYMSGFDTSCGDYHGWYGYYAWRVECNEDYIYISLKVRRETETEETVEEQPENVPEHETPETTTTSEVKECEYCRECIHYGKCSVYAPEKMECRTVNKLLCGSVVCCEDFVSRKSIDDIYEEQKAEQPENATESEVKGCEYCYDCIYFCQCDKDKSEFSNGNPCSDFHGLPF